MEVCQARVHPSPVARALRYTASLAWPALQASRERAGPARLLEVRAIREHYDVADVRRLQLDQATYWWLVGSYVVHCQRCAEIQLLRRALKALNYELDRFEIVD